MPRPLLKPHTVKVRLSDGDLAALRARCPEGTDLGPWLLSQAMANAQGSANPKAALEAWELRWLPTIRRSVPMMAPVLAALAALRKALG